MASKLVARGVVNYTVHHLPVTDTFSLKCGLETTFHASQKEAIEYAEEYNKGLNT